MPRAPRSLQTERLDLHCWSVTDAPELRAALDASDAHLRPWIPFMREEPRSLADTRSAIARHAAQFEAGEHYRYAIRTRDQHVLVGETMLIDRRGPGALEAGYWLHRDHCGRGFATEATRALLPIALQVLGMARVVLMCDERNHASIAVATRLGGLRVGTEEVAENGECVRLARLEITSTSPAPR